MFQSIVRPTIVKDDVEPLRNLRLCIVTKESATAFDKVEILLSISNTSTNKDLMIKNQSLYAVLNDNWMNDAISLDNKFDIRHKTYEQ